jgi:F0F1-type ATP synthase membrane subunit b/b'
VTSQELHDLLPYIVNFSIVVVAVFFFAAKPLRKHLYQRHERMRDAFQSAAIAHQKASERISAAKDSLAKLGADEKSLLQKEAESAKLECKEILDKASAEAKRVLAEADRLASVEQDESAERVKGQFLELVVREAEENLKRGLKKDDHSAILKRAQDSIEVGV